MGTFNWPPARTSTWPYTGTFSRPRTEEGGRPGDAEPSSYEVLAAMVTSAGNWRTPRPPRRSPRCRTWYARRSARAVTPRTRSR